LVLQHARQVPQRDCHISPSAELLMDG